MTVDLSKIELLLLDFDGVLTDNFVYVDDKGREYVRCSRADSLGIARLVRAGVDVQVVSTETSEVVSKRCRKLGIAYATAILNKAGWVRSFIINNYNSEAVAFMGNDVNDIGAMELCAVAAAPFDACREVLDMADWRSSFCGGEGAVRELCDAIIEAKENGRADKFRADREWLVKHRDDPRYAGCWVAIRNGECICATPDKKALHKFLEGKTGDLLVAKTNW